MSNALKLKKQYILGLASWLSEQSLAGRESRERSRFVELASQQLTETEKERKAIVEKYVEKNEDGSWKTTVDNGLERWVIPEDKKPRKIPIGCKDTTLLTS